MPNVPNEFLSHPDEFPKRFVGAPTDFRNRIFGAPNEIPRHSWCPDEFPKRNSWRPRRISKTNCLMPPTNFQNEIPDAPDEFPKRNFLVCYTCFNACWVSGHAWQPVVFEFVCDALTDISFSTLARMWWRRQRLIGRPFGGQAGIGTTKGHEPPSCAEIVRFIKRLVRIPLGGPLCCDISSKLIQPRNFLARCIGMFRLLGEAMQHVRCVARGMTHHKTVSGDSAISLLSKNVFNS